MVPHRRIAIASLATAALLLLPVLVSASTDRYLVGVRTRVSAEGAGSLLRDVQRDLVQARGVATFETLDAFAADLTAAEAEALRRTRDIRYVERVVERHILSGSRSPLPDESRNVYGQTLPAGVRLVRAPEVWNVTRGEGTNVVVMDTGVDYTHPELVHAWRGGFTAIPGSIDAKDDHNHGTHVAGTIAAADNDIGVVGVAPHVSLWAAKVFRSNGTGTSESIVAGLDWTIAQKRALGGNWIVNMSFGSVEESRAERDAVDRALAEGILLIGASGNDSTPTTPAPLLYPAAYPGVLAVGAVDPDLRHAPFSNEGLELGVVAPGMDVLSTVRVGMAALTAVLGDGFTLPAVALTGSAKGIATAPLVFCGVGRPDQYPPAVKGAIALVRRGGDITFALKTRRAKEAGAVAVLIANHNTEPLSFTLYERSDPTNFTYDWPVTLAVTQAIGDQLVADAGRIITIANTTDDYSIRNGTSMAAPHVTAVAALVWAVAPSATAEQVRNALKMSARDLGTPGFDPQHGHGLVDALAAGRMMNPAAFGSTEPTPSGRRTLRRGGS